MAYENLKLGVSPLTKSVFAGVQKVDVTSQFLSCVLQYFADGSENTIRADGKLVARITVERLDGNSGGNYGEKD